MGRHTVAVDGLYVLYRERWIAFDQLNDTPGPVSGGPIPRDEVIVLLADHGIIGRGDVIVCGVV